MALPTLTPEQRADALKKAAAARKKRAEVIDQHAAAFILQGALDRLARLRHEP